MSKFSPSDCATRLTSAARVLTPRLILPDFTTMACEVTLRITASSDADRPVVPMTGTMPRCAAMATLAMVAPATVKSRMRSASFDSAQRSADSSTPLAGNPASTPASLPSSSEPGASNAPDSTAPGVSAITRVSARPIRPPAPATIKRMSAMIFSSPSPYSRDRQFRQPTGRARGLGSSGSGLRTVEALDHDQVRDRMRLPHLDVGLVFRRVVAGQRRLIVREFDYHIAGAAFALDAGELAATHHVARAELLEDRHVGQRVGLVAFVVVNVDATDPVTFCHLYAP